MISKILNLFIFAPIIFLFLPAFAIYIPFLGGVYLIFFLSIYIALIILFILEGKIILNKLKLVSKITPLKIFEITFILIIINSMSLSLFGVIPISQTIRSLIIQLVLCILPIMIYFIYIIDTHINFEKFMRYFIILFWINLIVGFIAYIGQCFNITFINNIFDFLANQRLILFTKGASTEITDVMSNYETSGLPRLDNLFSEPAWYGRFLCIFLPITYFFASFKLQWFKNVVFDKIVKHTIVPFTIMNIIFTLSPFYLVLMFIISIIVYWKFISKILIKYSLFFFIILLIFISFISIDVSQTYLSRITNMMTEVHSFEDFVMIEPSLATRIVSYINTFRIFIHNSLCGIGIGELPYKITEQYMTSPVPLTFEILYKSRISLPITGQSFVNKNYICLFLAEHGIIIFCLFMLFLYKLYNEILHYCKIFGQEISYNLLFSQSLKYIFISLFIALFYDISFYDTYIYFIFAITIAFIYRNKLGDILQQKNIDLNSNK